ncbi:membrane-spanning 4-domains subfamily A member 4A-like isoform X2 [Brachyistius frenatus]|uniref:membrane-spanning 4-domains subfamily A member 4A-like isoform X2 n=1 Tax=Brachyistius frenatus TaxID=100188 RepID=UPI0037E9595F
MIPDDAAAVEEGNSPAQSPLVAVTFQRNVHWKRKYLEAEPKALGITQIGLSLFKVTCVSVFLSNGLSDLHTDVPFFISTLLVVIAGSVAIAAQNLHVPTLRACLGMQLLACVASVFNIICTLVKMEERTWRCWNVHFNTTEHYDDDDICHVLDLTESHFYASGVLVQAVLLAVSATLAAYCCKVVQCCGPPPTLPVITVQTPVQTPVPQ